MYEFINVIRLIVNMTIWGFKKFLLGLIYVVDKVKEYSGKNYYFQRGKKIFPVSKLNPHWVYRVDLYQIIPLFNFNSMNPFLSTFSNPGCMLRAIFHYLPEKPAEINALAVAGNAWQTFTGALLFQTGMIMEMPTDSNLHNSDRFSTVQSATNFNSPSHI